MQQPAFTKITAKLSREQVSEALLEWFNRRSVEPPMGSERFIEKLAVHGNGAATVELDTREIDVVDEQDEVVGD